MNDEATEALFAEFIAAAPNPADLVTFLPPAQAEVLTSIVANNAPVLAKEWHLPPPRVDLKERLDNNTFESDDVDLAFATTLTLTMCGYFAAQFLFNRGFYHCPVGFEQLQDACKENYSRNIQDFLTPDLERIITKCTAYLVEGYTRQEHISGMLKAGQISKKAIEDLVEKAILTGVFVWQMADLVRRRAN